MSEATQYEIEHVSRYLYESPVRQCVMLLYLRPRDDRRQRLVRFEVETSPLASMSGETDCFGNTRYVLNLHREHQALEITTRSKVELGPLPRFQKISAQMPGRRSAPGRSPSLIGTSRTRVY